MERNKIVEKITQRKRFLIDYANLSENLFLYQKKLFKNKKNFVQFLKEPHKGLPIFIPIKLPYFKYQTKTKNKFKIDKKFLKNKFFRIKETRKNYEPCNILSSFGSEYSGNVIDVLGKNNKKILEGIQNFNQKSKLNIKKVLKKYEKVCSFQTRNIPHLGHELIIKRLLDEFDHVIINPVIGPKKSGDVKYNVLAKSINFLIKKKFTHKKVSFIPILANMFYAGPFEALHHANIRAALGLKYFLIGRDHAGAQNMYKPDSVFHIVNKYKNKLKLNIIVLKGSYHCQECKKIVIKGDCNHKKLKNISGTDFRRHLLKKKIFTHADYDMQVYLKKFRSLFVK